MIKIKKQLHKLCLEFLDKRITVAKGAMDDAQQSANSEEKSSMGDKYETGRAMSQNVRDINAKQLQEALKDITVVKQLNPDKENTIVGLGAAVKTTAGNFYIAVSVGQLKIEKETWFALSAIAPIAQAILNKKAGDKYTFRGKEETVLEVF